MVSIRVPTWPTRFRILDGLRPLPDVFHTSIRLPSSGIAARGWTFLTAGILFVGHLWGSCFDVL